MTFVAAGAIFVVSAFWLWGAFTGRLPAMVAGGINPKWIA